MAILFESYRFSRCKEPMILFNISNRFGTKIDTKLLLCSKFAAVFA